MIHTWTHLGTKVCHMIDFVVMRTSVAVLTAGLIIAWLDVG